jgi:putative hydrolase of the HAD superfamily
LLGRKYVLTNAPREYAMRVLNTLRLAQCFDGVISIEDMSMFGQLRPKPDARMFRRLVAKLKLRAVDCVLVEDVLDNQKAARRIGMRTAWMQRYLEGRFRGHLRGGPSGGFNNASRFGGSDPSEVGVHPCPSPQYVCAKIKSLHKLLTL